MTLRGAWRMEALAGRPPLRRARRLRVAALVSALIHAAILVALLLTIRREEVPEQLPPPAAVTMLFESGRKSGPTLPNPSIQAAPPGAPAPAETVPLPEPPVPPAIEAPAPVKPPEPAEPPVAPEPARPAPAVQTPPVQAPQIESPPVPPLEAPPAPKLQLQPAPVVPAAPTPLPALPEPGIPVPPAPAAPLPLPPVPPPPVIRPAVPRPLPSPPSRQAAPQRPVPRNPSDFPAPMDFSFGTPHTAAPSAAAARPRSAPHIPGTIDMSLGPASKGTANPTPFSDRDEDAEGADWRNALSRWVSEHAYYPEQARREGDEGDAKVHVVVEPNGRVKMVELIGKSGSMWLDLALQALFRDQRIPALPYDVKEPFEFNFTMHYMLIRPR